MRLLVVGMGGEVGDVSCIRCAAYPIAPRRKGTEKMKKEVKAT
jgi:hypothetical protein